MKGQDIFENERRDNGRQIGATWPVTAHSFRGVRACDYRCRSTPPQKRVDTRFVQLSLLGIEPTEICLFPP